MTRVKSALAGGLIFVGIALVATLFESPGVVARTNKSPNAPIFEIASVTHRGKYCQPGETLPRSTSAIRLWLYAITGPRVHVALFSGKREIAAGTRGSGWTGGSVTIPLTPAVDSTVHNITVCMAIQGSSETVILQGGPLPSTGTGTAPPQSGLVLWIDYLQPGKRSWLSLAGGIAHRLGLGRSTGGAWIVVLVLALAVGLTALASYLVVSETT